MITIKSNKLSVLLTMILLTSILIFIQKPTCFAETVVNEINHNADSLVINDKKNILFISSYDRNFELVPEQIEGIQSVLPKEQYNLDIEYMDTKRIHTEEIIDIFHATLSYKLGQLPKYDAIIVGDDAALQFTMDYQEELFAGVPVIFLGINDFDRAEKAANVHNFNGIIEETSVRDNIDLALSFNPNANKVVAILDNSYTGIGLKRQYMACENIFPQLSFHIINASDYAYEELADDLEALGNDTILLFLSMDIDKTGRDIPIETGSKFIAAHTNIPVYRVSIGGIGDGILGGKMVSYIESGKLAAEMAIKAIDGVPLEEIPSIEGSPNHYIFDYNMIKKFKIDENKIPDGSTLVFKKLSLFQTYKKYILPVIAIIIILFIFASTVTVDNLRVRKLTNSLKENNKELNLTYEELSQIEEELRLQYNITHEYAKKLELLNQKYEIAIEGTHTAVWECDTELRTVKLSGNQFYIRDSQMRLSEDMDEILNTYISKEAKETIMEAWMDHISGKKDELNLQISIDDKNTGKKWVMIKGRGTKNSGNTITKAHGIISDITKIKEQEQYIEYLAGHDYLTGLPNRMTFTLKVEEIRNENIDFYIVIIDIDDFKRVNDTFGHIYGDKLLKETAVRLSSICGNHVYASRFGGDEFLLLIVESERDLVVRHIVRLQELFHKSIKLAGQDYYMRFSIGISNYPTDATDITGLVSKADIAMYQVKKTGKNGFSFYDITMKEESGTEKKPSGL